MADTALITGASGGIGEDLARLAAAGGSNVLLVARSTGKLQSLADELSRTHRVTATAMAFDLSQPGAADRLVEEISARGMAVDILVNNAGFGISGYFTESDPDAQMRLLQLNIVTLTVLTRRLLPAMVQRRHGRILNVASTAAFQAGALLATYSASKAYVLSFSEALFEETRGSGVTVTCLCPGPTRTGFQSRAGLENARLFSSGYVMSSPDVARAGYDGMMAGRAIVIPGLVNKIGVQVLRVSPRAVVRRVVRGLQSDRAR